MVFGVTDCVSQIRFLKIKVAYIQYEHNYLPEKKSFVLEFNGKTILSINVLFN